MAVNINQYKKKQQSSEKSGKDFLSDLLSKDISLGSGKISDKIKAEFYLELSMMLNAGVDLKTALEIFEQEQAKAKIRNIFLGIKERLISGATLSGAMASESEFSKYEIFSLEIGEESGKLSEVLDELHKYYDRRIKQRKQMISALSYPILIFSTSIAAIIFMLAFIVPMFSDIFKRFGGELPAMTQFILNISNAVTENYYYLLLVITVLILAWFNFRKTEWFDKALTKIILMIPLFGKIYKNIYLSRFCSSMALLTGAKVPLIKSMQLVRQMISFYPITTSLISAEKEILHGNTLFKSLSGHNIYSRKMLAQLKVGEEINQLESFFSRLSKQYSEEVDLLTNLLGTFLEPIIIIVLGLFVGFILIAMYLPMFEISSSMGL